MQYRLKINPFPSGIGEDRRTVVEPHAVAGENRFKYFRRPIMPYQPIFSGQIIYAKKAATTKETSVQVGLDPTTLSHAIGTPDEEIKDCRNSNHVQNQ